MVVNDWIHTIAGLFIIVSVTPGMDSVHNPFFVHKDFLFFTFFVGANLFQ